jgi:hypothetical protein
MSRDFIIDCCKKGYQAAAEAQFRGLSVLSRSLSLRIMTRNLACL